MPRYDTTGLDSAGRDFIELRVPARAPVFATVRAVAAEVALRADFGFDAVADVRMAVDEACNQLAHRAAPEHQTRVVFRRDDGLLRVTVNARAIGDGGLEAGGFGWRVLAALTDELEIEHNTGTGGDEIVIRFASQGPVA